MVYKDKDGYYRFKIVFYGPSLSGKTTMLKAIYNKVTGLKRGKIRSIEEPSGRTLYFDYAPLAVKGKVVFDVYTVPGQKRHKHQRKILLRGVDSIVFVADSDPNALKENVYSMNELLELLGDKVEQIPIVVALNKRDLPDALPRAVLIKALKLDNKPFPVFQTVAKDGLGVKRVFHEAARLAIMAKLYPDAFKSELENLAKETRERL